MVHAFLILTYSHPEQVLQQVLRMMAPDRHFYIHINRMTEFAEDNAAFLHLVGHPQVTMISDRIKVQWGSFRAVEAHLALLQAALSGEKADYFHLISGECLPVKSPSQFNEFFGQHGGREFIAFQEMPKSRRGGHGWGPNRLDKYHFYELFNPRSKEPKDVVMRYLNQAFRISQRALKKMGIYRRYPSSFPPVYVGSTWWSLTRECCAWIVKYLEEHTAFLHRFRFTQYPEEMLFHTVLASSPFRQRLVNNNLRFIEFANPRRPHATPVTMQHLPLLETPDILIARKFTDESDSLIEHLTRSGALKNISIP